MASEIRALPDDYAAVLAELKGRVRSAQLTAQRRVNTALIELYWELGHTILRRQADASWGGFAVTRLAEDLRAEFPQMKGFSRSNLFSMRAFAQAWPAREEVVQQAVGLLPWGHIVLLLQKLDDSEARSWYADAAAEHGWSRNVLSNQIMNRTRERIGSAPSNFAGQLAPADSDLARQLAKDPYVFDFLELTGEVAERQLEQALMDRIVDTLRELGAGFAFVGRQVHFDVDGDDFYADLIFFHTEQLRYVVIELKTGRFEPAFTGQLGFYVAVVDDRMRRDFHRPTVGILICGGQNEHTVRYALSQTGSPMAVSSYTYESLPPAEQAALPTAEQITAALDRPDSSS
ncbi:putative nuclease of restriction endonuclease-like (RecB) superfamily [Rathayibacter sp. PhB151]|uniref:PDDEXK nuclease domain-containing protein n=1 Tax=Rathayibacter sp. PhB151 TaxID=2485189 RepID=UPI0010D2F839|nr:PDDEXK nuclease domain-containing protein [Rathayibacter sp. PhB151]TDX74966.1 putative nuclease of restriction endonuclease-like (RecB) superfamily [Rathayibacter sp. PhB151]